MSKAGGQVPHSRDWWGRHIGMGEGEHEQHRHGQGSRMTVKKSASGKARPQLSHEPSLHGRNYRHTFLRLPSQLRGDLKP